MILNFFGIYDEGTCVVAEKVFWREIKSDDMSYSAEKFTKRESFL